MNKRMNNPENILAVLIPHYNDRQGLEKSLESIEEDIPITVLIVDDGSDEFHKPQENRLTKICRPNINLHFHYLVKNKGIEHALNEGLLLIKRKHYNYVARLDCGDKCFPKRFETQLNFMKANPKVKLLGTQVKHVDTDGKFLFFSNLPTKYNEIKSKFYVSCQIIHPTVMFKMDILEEVGLYPLNYPAAEDYAFFMKIIQTHEAENLKEVFLEKLIDEKSISTVKRKKQIISKIKVILHYFHFGFYPIYGLLRSVFSLLLSRELTTKLKSRG